MIPLPTQICYPGKMSMKCFKNGHYVHYVKSSILKKTKFKFIKIPMNGGIKMKMVIICAKTPLKDITSMLKMI